MLRLSTVLWILLLASAFLALGNDRAEAAETALASWYGPGFEGLPTASGEPYDPHGYTAAHKTLPLGTQLLVSYEGRSVEVTVNDRGPYVGQRELDLSQGAAKYLGIKRVGVDYVEYSYADGGYEIYSAGYSSGTGYSEAYVSSGATDGVYVVQSGDTLSGIAAGLGMSVEDLAAANGIANPDFVYAGQTLYY